MKTHLLLPCLLAVPLLADTVAPKAPYPPAPRGDVVEKLHGVDVPDPYRWLEDVDSEATKSWVEAEAKLAHDYLEGLPGRAGLKQRLEELWNYDKHGLPEKTAGRLFYTRKTGLQNQGVHYWREDKPDAKETVLLDPNTLSKDGTVSVAGSSVSEDGKFFAYGLSRSGSDWEEWKVIDVDKGVTMADELKWVKFSGASWAKDGSGFYYNRYDEPKAGGELKESNINQKIFFHRLGTAQSGDSLVYAREDQPKWMFGADATEDGRYLIIEVSEGAAGRNAVFYRDLAAKDSPVVELLKSFDARYRFVGHEGATFFFFTDLDAPRGRLVAIDLGDPAPAKWRTIIPEGKSTLQFVTHLAGRFIAQTLVDAHDEVHVFDAAGSELSHVALPNLGAVTGFSGRREDTETFYVLTGYNLPAAIFRYDVPTGKSTPFWQPQVKFNPDDYVTQQVFFHSKDGTRIPMFVSHKKGLAKNGTNPTILYGYGGFNIALGPNFSPSILLWMELGGVYAVANLRGGGEYGEDWHKAGQKLKKQNVFDDFISAAEFLIREKFTSTPKLAISGGSNGGLLVGACLLQRPDLFGAAAPAVGVHDLLRFQKFTIGWAWQDEFGFPEKDEVEFKNLLKLSPYHNVKPGAYPPTLIATADHDDRVFPAHSFKFGAALQAAQGAPFDRAPVLLRIETKAGHGAGTPTSKMIDRVADDYAFFARALGMKLPDPKIAPQ